MRATSTREVVDALAATSEQQPGAGLINNYYPFNAEFCMTHQVMIPDNDSFICGQQFGESNHWMEGMDDGGQYVMNSNRIRQPFDFAGRTGNVVWDVDAKTEGSHSFWTEVWITDEPVQGRAPRPSGHPHLPPQRHDAAVRRRLVRRRPIRRANALREVVSFTNYQQTTYTVRSPCFATQDDHAEPLPAEGSPEPRRPMGVRPGWRQLPAASRA